MSELANDGCPLDIPEADRPVGATGEEVAGKGGGVGERRHRTGAGVQFLDRLRRRRDRIDRRGGKGEGKRAHDAVGFRHGQLRSGGGHGQGTDPGRPHEPPRHVPIGCIGRDDAAVGAGRVDGGPVGREGHRGDGGGVGLERPAEGATRGINEDHGAVGAAAGGGAGCGGDRGDPGCLRHFCKARGPRPLPELDGPE